MTSIKKTATLLLTTGLLLMGGMITSASAETLTFSPTTTKSSIKFVSEAPQEKIVGTASKIEGKVDLDMESPEKASGSVRFPVKGMNTGNATRDEHMHGADWLNAEAHPYITFEISSLKDPKAKGDAKKRSILAQAVGTVTVNGKTAPATAKVKIAVLADGRAKVEFKDLTVALGKHDVAGKKGVVGAKVGQTIDVSGVLYGKAK